MSKKKRTAPTSAKAAGPKRARWIAIGVAAVIVVALLAISTGGAQKGVVTATGSASTAGADPAEAKYIGRLLPAAYAEPKLADVTVYDGVTKMTELTATQTDTQISIPADKLLASKIVYFEYAKAGAKPLPMIAYVKPSGRVFVGVSYCPPCEGERQRIEADLTLTCESCGTKRNIETGVGISGACKLYPLDEVPATLAGGNITVDRATLDSWTAQPKDRAIG